MVNSKQQSNATVGNEPLSEETIEMVAAMLRVLSDPIRIRLIEVLNDRGGATVAALTACVPVSQPGVSKHLSVLHNAGIVSRKPQGMWVRYELTDFTGLWLIQQLASGLATSPASSSS
jgi:ArsR family transcriptional regulator, arsenate/arsenite/antimonite-responsive transcriptional repressor